VWLQTVSSSQGEVTSMDVFLDAHVPSPPRHIHLKQEERFKVISGAVVLQSGGVRRVLQAGEEAVIPPGVAHTWATTGDGPAHVEVDLRPGLHFEESQESIFWLVRNGKMNPKRIGNILQAATLFHHYMDEARMASPPPVVQRPLFSLLAAIGRRAGYTARPGQRGLPEADAAEAAETI
jgi:quercetin dioxygenase-like cupin family protein